MITIRRATENDINAIAAIHRAAREAAMPYLPDLHTPEEDRDFFANDVMNACTVLAAQHDAHVIGFIAFKQGWIEHLYIDPAHQGQGIGSALLEKAMEDNRTLLLWTFARNADAQRFYEAKGFQIEDRTDGSNNHEKQPDILYKWEKHP